MRWSFGVCVFLTSITAALAEPSSVVRYLVNEPVNALDFGLYLLTQQLRGQRTYDGLPGQATTAAITRYDGRRNRMIVDLLVYADSAQSIPLEDAKKGCASAIQNARLFARSGEEPTAVAFFRHSSFRDPKEPDNFAEELLAMIEFRVGIYPAWSKETSEEWDAVVKCEGSLMSKDVLFKE